MNIDNTLKQPVDDSAYFAWRTQKLAYYPLQITSLIVDIKNPYQVSPQERQQLAHAIQRANLAIYRFAHPEIIDKNALTQFGAQLGLQRIDTTLCTEADGITALQVANAGEAQDYIPYSNHPLSWHTDGYYNAPEAQVWALLMYCVRQAASGGENAYVDHELAYIHLRDTDPRFITALMQAKVMTIPANIQQGQIVRAENTGPVFQFDGQGRLHMRYSGRQRYIEWLPDSTVQDAVACLREFLASDSPYHLHYRLNAGEGVLCNNVLHNRTGFQDGEEEAARRLVYRIRYYDRLNL